MTKKESYSQKDHFHCWQQAMNPACGQKIKHFECCLCQMLNPAISTSIQEVRVEGEMAAVKSWYAVLRKLSRVAAAATDLLFFSEIDIQIEVVEAYALSKGIDLTK